MSTYLYGVVGSSHPQKLTELLGVGAQRAQIRGLGVEDIVAVVSDAPDGLRAKRRDVLAHEEVLEALCAQGPTLPMRFGVVGTDDESVLAEVAERAEEYERLLRELTGYVEINVKARHHEDEVLRQVLLENSQLREQHERMQTNNGGTHQERIDFGQKVANAVEGRAEQDADALLEHLSGLADRRYVGSPVGDTFLNASFLVDGEKIGTFEAAVASLRERVASQLELRIRGPLPPYSFVEVRQPAPEIAQPS